MVDTVIGGPDALQSFSSEFQELFLLCLGGIPKHTTAIGRQFVDWQDGDTTVGTIVMVEEPFFQAFVMKHVLTGRGWGPGKYITFRKTIHANGTFLIIIIRATGKFWIKFRLRGIV